MEFDGNNLLQYTIQKKIIAKSPKTVSQINYAPMIDANVETAISEVSKINLCPVSGHSAVDTLNLGGADVDMFGNISDTELVNLYNTQAPTDTIKFATTYSNFTPEEISHIKQLIYNMHNSSSHTASGNIGGSGGTKPDDAPGSTGDNTGTPTKPDDDSGTTVTKKSFVTEFSDVDTMFEYLERLTNGEVNKSTGITRAQLVYLTQNEQWEDNNNNFWATLNRIFNSLDTNKDGDSSYTNDVLSYDEIKNFIGEEIGEDAMAYLSKVNTYAQQLQNEYKSLSKQEKLNFVIERTKEYLESAGMDKQLKALNRLLSEQDKFNTKYSAKAGQIVMAPIESDNDKYITLGAYSSASFAWEYDDESSSSKYPFTVNSFGFDFDDSDVDRGITLNEIMLDWSWYELVDTLVHELTHATAYQWYPNPPYTSGEDGLYNLRFEIKQVEALRNAGVLTNEEYNFYLNHWSSMFSSSATAEESKYFNRLMYLLECQWGEYAAYQADADYVDSIAGDIFNCKNNSFGNNKMTTAVRGTDESSTISNHIQSAYNTAGMTIKEFANLYGYSESDIRDNDGDGTISYGDKVMKNGTEIDIYSKEAKPDYDWNTYNKNKNWKWSA